MKRMKKTQIRAFLLVVIVSGIMSQLCSNIAGITKEPEMQVKYTLKYETDSNEFASELIDLTDSSYKVDDYPESSQGNINVDYYQINASDIQEPLFNVTDSNETKVRIHEPNNPSNYTQVTPEDTYSIAPDKDASFKVSGIVDTWTEKINVTSVSDSNLEVWEGFADYTGDIEDISYDNAEDIVFSPSRDHEYYTHIHRESAKQIIGNSIQNFQPGYITNIANEYIDNVEPDWITNGGYWIEGTTRLGYQAKTAMVIEMTTDSPPNMRGDGDNILQLVLRNWIQDSNTDYPEILEFGCRVQSAFKIYLYDREISEATGEDTWDLVGFEATDFKTVRDETDTYPFLHTQTFEIPVNEEHWIENAPGWAIPIYKFKLEIYTRNLPSMAVYTECKHQLVTATTRSRLAYSVGNLNLENLGYGQQIYSPVDITIDADISGKCWFYIDSGLTPEEAGENPYLLWEEIGTIENLQYDTPLNRRLELEDIEFNIPENPRILFAFQKWNSPYFDINFVQLEGFIFDFTIEANISTDSGGEIIPEIIPLIPSTIEFDGLSVFTFEAEGSSRDFTIWDRESSLYMPSEPINVTFTMPRKGNYAIFYWALEYSVNTIRTPSQQDLIINEAEVSDTTINSGIVEFGDFQTHLEASASRETQGKIDIEAIMSLTTSLTTITKTFLKDTWTLEKSKNVKIIRIEILNVENISHVYIAGEDYGSTNVISPNIDIQKGGTFRLSIVLNEPVYKRAFYSNAIDEFANNWLKVTGYFPYQFENAESQIREFEIDDFYESTGMLMNFDAINNITYYQENFDDEIWDNSIISQNGESEVVYNETLEAYNISAYGEVYDESYTLEDNFHIPILKRDYTNPSINQIEIDGNITNTIDNGTLEYTQNLPFSEFLEDPINKGGDNFDNATEGQNLDDRNGWDLSVDGNLPAGSTAQIVTFQGSKRARLDDNTGTENITAFYNFKNQYSLPTMAGLWLQVDFYIDNGLQGGYLTITGDTANQPCLLRMDSNNINYNHPIDGWTNFATFLDATWYRMKIYFKSSNTFFVELNGTKYDGLSCYTFSGGIRNLRIDTGVTHNNHLSYWDNIIPSWTRYPLELLPEFDSRNEVITCHPYSNGQRGNWTLDTPYSSGTWEVSFQFNDTDDANVLYFYAAYDATNSYIFWIKDSKIVYWDGIHAAIEIPNVIFADTWHHIRFDWFSDQTGDIYLDDVLMFDDIIPTGSVTGVQILAMQFETLSADKNISSYIDAIGFTGYPGYSIGDNKIVDYVNYNKSLYELRDGGIRAFDFEEYSYITEQYEPHEDIEEHSIDDFSRAITFNIKQPVAAYYRFPEIIDTSQQDYWIEFWYKGNVENEVSPTVYHDLFFLVGDRFSNVPLLGIEENIDFIHSYSIPIDTWTHFSFHVQAANIRTYVNDIYIGLQENYVQYHESFIIDFINAGLDFNISNIGVTGINDYEKGDNLKFQHHFNVTHEDFEDNLDDWSIIVTPPNEIFELRGEAAYTGNYGLYLEGGDPYPLGDYTTKVKNPSAISFYFKPIYFNTHYCLEFQFRNIAGGQHVRLRFFKNDAGEATFSIKSEVTGSYQSYQLEGDDWLFNQWYHVKTWFNWKEGKISVQLDDNHVMVYETDLPRIEQIRIIPDYPGLAVQTKAYIDDFVLTQDNKFHNFFDNPLDEPCYVNFTINVDSIQLYYPIYFKFNDTTEIITDNGLYYYTFITNDLYYEFEHYFNNVSINITLNYTSFRKYANVTESLDLTDYWDDIPSEPDIYTLSLILNFTSLNANPGSGGSAFVSIDSDLFHYIEDIWLSANYSINLTRKLYLDSLTIENWDMTEFNVSFEIEGNESTIQVDNITLYDNSLQIFIDGSPIASNGSFSIDYEASSLVEVNISRLNPNPFDAWINLTCNFTIEIDSWYLEYEFYYDEVNYLDFDRFVTKSLLLYHGLENEVDIYFNAELVDNINYAINYTYAEHEHVFTPYSITIMEFRAEIEDEFILKQLTPEVDITSESVEYQFNVVTNESYKYFYFEVNDSYEVIDLSIKFLDDNINVERENNTNTFYFEHETETYALFQVNVLIKPNFQQIITELFNNGTFGRIQVNITSDIWVENVTTRFDLTSYDIFFQNWITDDFETNIVQAESKIVTLRIPRVNESTGFIMNGSGEVPIAQITRYRVSGGAFINIETEILAEGVLTYPSYSRAFKINESQLGRDYVLDGVQYNEQAYDIENLVFFVPNGFGTGISGSYVRFTAYPFNSVQQITLSNKLERIDIESSIPVIEAAYIFTAERGGRRVVILNQNLTTFPLNESHTLITQLSIPAGITSLYIKIRVVNPLDNVIFLIPIIAIGIGALIFYYYRKNPASFKRFNPIQNIVIYVQKSQQKQKKRRNRP